MAKTVKRATKKRTRVSKVPKPSKKKKIAPLESSQEMSEPRRPAYNPPKFFFTGGGLPMSSEHIPPGFFLASEPKPAGYHVSAVCSYRTAPEGEIIRCVRYEPDAVDASAQEELRRHAEARLAEISQDDAAALVAREYIFFGVRRGGCRR